MVLINAVRTKGFEVSQARTAIICAPFALCTAALWTVRKAYAKEEAESEIASTLANAVFQFLYVMAILLYFVFLAYAPFLLRYNAARAPGSAAFTFPTVIFATAMVRSHEFNPLLGKMATQILAYIASIIATSVVLCVTFQFAVLLRGLWMSAASSNSTPGSQCSQDTGHPKEAEVVSSAIYMAEVVGSAEQGVDAV
jgi:tellurite resistance protein TehA-like permease